MSKIENAVRDIHFITASASRNQWVNLIHPLVKFALTAGYILAVVSFPKYDLAGLAGMAVYPAAVFILADLSFLDAVRRIYPIFLFPCLLGICNPFFDKNTILIFGMTVSAGILSMMTLIIKGVFTVLASYLLIATTPIDKLCYALRMLHIPKEMVTQIMLTYRYLTVLLEEGNSMIQAYALRAPKQKGIHFKAWGSLAGQLLLRSVDRAGAVYESMLMRGYSGDYFYLKEKISFRRQDVAYGLFWAGIILLFRKYPVVLIAGNLAGGMLK